jgi:hypothetical protein
MTSYGGLASTGAAVTIGSLVLGQALLLAIAVGLVLLGAACVRFSFRRGMTPGDV